VPQQGSGAERGLKPDFAGVVVAAGQSSRFGQGLPKQFQDLGGRTVLERSVRALARPGAVRGVVVVLPADQVDGPRGRMAASWPGVERTVAGGETRADSVLQGILAAADLPYVLVHDAARPLVSEALVGSVIDATRRHGAAVPLLAIPDTVKSVDGTRVTGTLRRQELGLAQTPQGARTDWLRPALEAALRDHAQVTDEAAALERHGHEVTAVPGEAANGKITTPEDLARARRRVAPATRLRVGTGFDIHTVDPARPLFLGGVHFEDAPGLAGHSDADVVLHAAMDALLGAGGLGDIGAHFPPGEARWAGADSKDLARRVAALLAERGLGLVNLDLMLLAEAPKIRDRVERMRETIAECLGTEPDRISLKATTLEGIGSLGRGEGIACQAVALVEAMPGED
jgi:2-C-methyl-D-erythritol 4-phosphate cytidylyltransferase/2-C-methyl-D-erythritol 2,4-cyclodiphosphate synthase